ncbi:MAG TPA: hypothetical protein PKM41_12965 [Deltaproteobacteria bacterium]|jgi:phage tail protein X|nr:hypothetical protein [Deltaproteobacteria bacterium]HOI07962.1 hypothetical protein [Deltaproteobacteria bacterium]
MKRAAVLLAAVFLLAPALCGAEEITLFKHAYRKGTPPPKSDYPQYRVKKGDTLRKIFLKDFNARPEDLPALYRKFRQHNPGVRDLNRILSGYRVTIPTIPQGQRAPAPARPAPVVSGNVIVIKKGQHLAKVLREVYGLSDEAIFHGYMDKIRKLNPDIEDLNLLVEGQKVRLPDMSAPAPGAQKVAKTPAVQAKPTAPEPWKARRVRILELDEKAGGQAVSVAKKAPPSPRKPAPQRQEKKAPPVKSPVQQVSEAQQDGGGGQGEPSGQIVSPAAMDGKDGGGSAKTTEADEAREREAIEVVRGSVLPALREMGASQRDHGTYFLPVAGDKIVSIDAVDVPIIDLDMGRRIILDVNDKISPETRKLIEQAHPSTRVVSGPAGNREALMERILDACSYFSVNRDSGPVLVGGDEKLRFFGRWVIYKDRSRRSVIVVNLLSDEDFRVSDEIKRYAARFGIRLVEMGGRPARERTSAPGAMRSLGRSHEKLLGVIGVDYEKDKVLSLVSLETVKISYTAPIAVGKVLITPVMPDKTMLELLQKTGYTVIDARTESLANVLDALGLEKLGPPVRVVIAKGRAELDLPAVQVGDMTILEHPVDKDIAKFLTTEGVKALVW